MSDQVDAPVVIAGGGLVASSMAMFLAQQGVTSIAIERLRGGRPGARAPHVWLRRAGERLSTLDLFGRGFVLLAGADGRDWCAAA